MEVRRIPEVEVDLRWLTFPVWASRRAYGTLLGGKVLVAASTLRVLVIGINRRKEHNEQNIPCSAAVDGVDADYRLR